MEEKKTSWGKKLTGGIFCAVMIREIVMAKPEMAPWGIGAILILGVIYQVTQLRADRKGT